MFSFNQNYTVITDKNGKQSGVSENNFLFLYADGSLELRGAMTIEASEAMKKELIAIDIDGGAVNYLVFDRTGIKVDYSIDSADSTQPTEGHFEHDYPIAIHRKKGAFALVIYDANAPEPEYREEDDASLQHSQGHE